MTGAVAFVFGMCALSFAAGCVVTAVMLRRDEPAVEAVVPEEPVERALVVWPPEDFAARPIHRNPVVGFVGADLDGPLAPVIELVPGLVVEPVVVDEPYDQEADGAELVVGPELEFEPVELPDFEPVVESVVEPVARVLVSVPRQPERMPAHNEEFRQRYLRTFEAARRRASR